MNTMNYAQTMDFLSGTLKFGSQLGLKSIGELLDVMGNPQNSLKFIHVAGTNGKGSTSSYISSTLISAGYRVGLYISPYVEEFTERIQVNGNKIDKDELCKIASFVKICIEKMVSEGKDHPTEFEIVTAIGFEYFKRQKCDFVVLEVGLGGRFDATNIISKSLISIITLIGYDHMEYLGNTIPEICYEKCGIIKENGIVVSYPLQPDEATPVILRNAQEKNAKLYTPNIENLVIIKEYHEKFRI